jgi:hypothetical protein
MLSNSDERRIAITQYKKELKMKAAFTLIPSESKRLIGKGIVQMDPEQSWTNCQNG